MSAPIQWCNCRPDELATPHRMGVEGCRNVPASPERVCRCSAYDVPHPVGLDRCGRTEPWRTREGNGEDEPIKGHVINRDARTVYALGDGTYVIAEDGCWLPGVYTSEESAWAAFDGPKEMREYAPAGQLAALRAVVAEVADELEERGGRDDLVQRLRGATETGD